MPSETRRLADFLASLRGSVEPRLIDRAVDYLVDTLGATVYGATQPWARMVIDHALATGGGGPCSVVGDERTTTPAMAALANGGSAHAFELDDVHEEAISHPGAVVVPAAMALAEELDRSGTELLEAIVVGYEAMGRADPASGSVRPARTSRRCKRGTAP
jgi:2-methylcitrate dehydratase PrpD